MADFEIESSWHSASASKDDLSATLCDLNIVVAGTNITTFEAEDELGSDTLTLPAYHLAEWIAENWWALLWEPRKNEDGQIDEDYYSRHSFLYAQRGFYLPQLNIVPNGQYVQLISMARSVPFSDVRFVRRANVLTERRNVEDPLRRFVNSTVEQMEAQGVAGTNLQDLWSAINSTDEEVEPYCRLMGALGLSPYAADTATTDRILEDFVTHLGEGLALDMCSVARPTDLFAASHVAKVAVAVAHQAQEVDLTPILQTVMPDDNLAAVPWLRGVRAAQAIRDRFNLDLSNTSAADRVFEAVKIDPSQRASIGKKDFQPEGAAISGAALRHENTAQISAIQRHEQQRRFAAARALYAAWASKVGSAHLMTQAVTRFQQANRAFAAELLAPISYIRSRASKSQLTSDAIDEIAGLLNVGADVVQKQAVNNGLIVVRSNHY